MAGECFDLLSLALLFIDCEKGYPQDPGFVR